MVMVVQQMTQNQCDFDIKPLFDYKALFHYKPRIPSCAHAQIICTHCVIEGEHFLCLRLNFTKFFATTQQNEIEAKQKGDSVIAFDLPNLPSIDTVH